MITPLEIDPEINIGHRLLGETYQTIQRDLQVPFQVWLLENPKSFMPLPGNISLPNHDCLHLLLNRGFSPEDEAFILGFTMGNDLDTGWLHVQLFKLASRFFYPKKYQFSLEHLKRFDLGFLYGRQIAETHPNLNRLDFLAHAHCRISEVRDLVGIRMQTLRQLWETECLLTTTTLLDNVAAIG
ncbi:MAG: hypothetical protein QNJ46_34780 [Leptolyngbyaceae cyanobacterium MO_188.B28]|nr:hypothetical protein [Leptolyngbyaceae cyanobacterium MO_188.B28]